MKIDYNNLYTHFIFNTFMREASIPKESRIRIEKYKTGVVNNNSSKLYAIYVNPDHTHFLISRSPSISDVDKVCKYILNQPEHHKKVTFSEEYDQFIEFYQESIHNKVNKVN